jgi:hypothetical protein
VTQNSSGRTVSHRMRLIVPSATIALFPPIDVTSFVLRRMRVGDNRNSELKPSGFAISGEGPDDSIQRRKRSASGCGSARHGAGTKALTRIFTIVEPRPNSRLPQRRRPYAKSSKVAVAITFPSLATISNSLPATASQRNSTVEPSAPPNSI